MKKNRRNWKLLSVLSLLLVASVVELGFTSIGVKNESDVKDSVVATEEVNNDVKKTYQSEGMDDILYIKDLPEEINKDKKEELEVEKEEKNTSKEEAKEETKVKVKEEAEEKKPEKEKAAEKPVEKKEKPKTKTTKPSFTEEPYSADLMSKVSLNIRKGPSASFGKVGSLSPYKKANAIGTTNYNGSQWHKIKYGNTTGWVAASYTTKYAERKTPKPSASSQSQSSSKYRANSIYMAGKRMGYFQSSGEDMQSSVNSANNSWVSGGTYPSFNPNDNKGTYFAAHSNKGGSALWGMNKGNLITVTDSKGNPHVYKVFKIYYKNTNDNFTAELAGELDMEYVIFQTCERRVNGKWIGNRHVLAEKVK